MPIPFQLPLRVAACGFVLLAVLGCNRNEPQPMLVPEPAPPPVTVVPPLPDVAPTTVPQQPQPAPGQNNDHSSPAFKGGPTDKTQ